MSNIHCVVLVAQRGFNLSCKYKDDCFLKYIYTVVDALHWQSHRIKLYPVFINCWITKIILCNRNSIIGSSVCKDVREGYTGECFLTDA